MINGKMLQHWQDIGIKALGAVELCPVQRLGQSFSSSSDLECHTWDIFDLKPSFDDEGIKLQVHWNALEVLHFPSALWPRFLGDICVTLCTFVRSCEAVLGTAGYQRDGGRGGGLFAWEGSVWEGVCFWGRGVCNGNRDVYVGMHTHMWCVFPLFPGLWVCPEPNSKCSFFGTVASSLVWHLKNLGESFKDQKTPFTWAPEGFTFCDMVIPVDWALSPADEPI